MSNWHLRSFDSWSEYRAFLKRAGTGREEMAEAAREWDCYVMSEDCAAELEADC